MACNTSKLRVQLGMELRRYSKPEDSCDMHPWFVLEAYVNAFNSHISAFNRARFEYAVRALSSLPDRLLQPSKIDMGGGMWNTSLLLPDELWRTAVSNHDIETREVST